MHVETGTHLYVTCVAGGSRYDSKAVVYKTTIGQNLVIQRQFEEFEKFYWRIKEYLPKEHHAPPQRKLLQSDKSLVEKRKQWIVDLCSEALNNSRRSPEVYVFFSSPNGNLAQHENIHAAHALPIPTTSQIAPLREHNRKSPEPLNTSSDFLSSNASSPLNSADISRASFAVQRNMNTNCKAQVTDFEVVRAIGKGTFGQVFQVTHIETGTTYAMKVLYKSRVRQNKDKAHVMAERNVLKANLYHPFLVGLHYAFQTKTKLFFVMDFLSGGELFRHLQKERRFSENTTRFYAASIASALGYLHDNNIVYRDLKPENLMLDRFGYVVLTDFGLCKERMYQSATTMTFCGTPEYMAPEIILRHPYDKSVDWWCLGVCIYEMVHGKPPFSADHQNELFDKILTQPIRIRHSVTKPTEDIVFQLLSKVKSERLGVRRGFYEISAHPFFETIDWDKLLYRELKAPFLPKSNLMPDDKYIPTDIQYMDQDTFVPSTNFPAMRDQHFHGFSYCQ